MPITVNLRHLERKDVHLEGEISARELEIDDVDEVVHTKTPLTYDLTVEQNGPNLLITGRLTITLSCECVRCLKPVRHPITMDPYNAFVPLEGEDAARVSNDLVDLTPYIREDILLAFPQHPVCEAECESLPLSSGKKQSSGAALGEISAWDKLNKLKLK
jgi:uncharacterized metal-binding protein YceD (DUF177 family)